MSQYDYFPPGPLDPRRIAQDGNLRIVRVAMETDDLASRYAVEVGRPYDDDHRVLGCFRFQVGAMAKYGRNGISDASLLAILIDRIKGHQAGKHCSPHNETIQYHLQLASEAMTARLVERLGSDGENINRP